MKKAEEKIQLKEVLKQKLDQKNLTDKDWTAIGKQKILQTTVLDDIFKKFNDYQEIKPGYKTLGQRTIDDWDKAKLRLPPTLKPIAAGNESDDSLESPTGKRKKLKTTKAKPAEDIEAARRKAEDALVLLQHMEDATSLKHAGRISLR